MKNEELEIKNEKGRQKQEVRKKKNEKRIGGYTSSFLILYF